MSEKTHVGHGENVVGREPGSPVASAGTRQQLYHCVPHIEVPTVLLGEGEELKLNFRLPALTFRNHQTLMGCTRHDSSGTEKRHEARPRHTDMAGLF